MTPTPGTLHLLVGPVGAGKTHYARRRIARAPALLLDADTWLVRLYGNDARPAEDVMGWYLERRERCRELLWDLACSALSCGTDVFLELGLLQRVERELYYVRARSEDIKLLVYVLDAPRTVRRERVVLRNGSTTPHRQVVPLEVFERASDAWESPRADERAAWGLLDV